MIATVPVSRPANSSVEDSHLDSEDASGVPQQIALPWLPAEAKTSSRATSRDEIVEIHFTIPKIRLWVGDIVAKRGGVSCRPQRHGVSLPLNAHLGCRPVGGRSCAAVRLLRAHGVLMPAVVAPGTCRSALINGRKQ